MITAEELSPSTLRNILTIREREMYDTHTHAHT